MNWRVGLGLLVALQGGLLLGYLGVERARTVSPSDFAVRALDEPVPEWPISEVDVEAGVVLVHFWATWCGPCVEELPALLDAAEAADVPLVAVTDEPPAQVRQFFEGQVPAAVAFDPTGQLAERWGASSLPDTYVVRDGRVIGRMGGARDWRAQSARTFLMSLRSP